MGHEDRAWKWQVTPGICGNGRPDWHRPRDGQGCGAPGAPGGRCQPKPCKDLGGDASNSIKKQTEGVNRHVTSGKIISKSVVPSPDCAGHAGTLTHQDGLLTWVLTVSYTSMKRTEKRQNLEEMARRPLQSGYRAGRSYQHDGGAQLALSSEPALTCWPGRSAPGGPLAQAHPGHA